MPEVHQSRTTRTTLESVIRAESVNQDDWCAFSTADKKSFLVGRTLAFGYLSGKTNKELQYSRNFVKVDYPKSGKSVGVGVLCVWYSLKGNSLVPDASFSHGYHDISYYICTIPRPKLVSSSLSLDKNTSVAVRSFFRNFKLKK